MRLMITAIVTSEAFAETYAFEATDKSAAGHFIAFLISVGMIPDVEINVEFTDVKLPGSK